MVHGVNNPEVGLTLGTKIFYFLFFSKKNFEIK